MTMKMVDSGMFACCSEKALNDASAVTTARELLASSGGECGSAAGPVSCWSNGFPVSAEVVFGRSASVEAVGEGECAVGLVTCSFSCSFSCSLFSFLLVGTATFSNCFFPFIHADPMSLDDTLRS